MFEHYLAALLSLRQMQDLAHSALPHAPVRPDREDRDAEAAPANPPVAAGPNRSSQLDPCPCRQWGTTRADHHGCAAQVTERFPELDAELDAWEANHGWLYH